MGGRGGGSSGGGASGGVNPANIGDTTSLISARERYQEEVDATLSVLRDVQDRYGVIVTDAQLAELSGKDSNVMAYYDAVGNLAVNTKYFDSGKMDAAYDDCVKTGFHPGRGNKSGMEAVVSHEMGHRLTDAAGERAGYGSWQLDTVARGMVQRAAKATGYGQNMTAFTAKISGYAKGNWAEAVAEAFSDVYCNGSRARRESRALVAELDKYF